MKIPNDVLALIQDEQERQGGHFIPSDPAYLEKLACKAELVVHYLPEGLAGFIFFYCNDPEKKICYITLVGTELLYRNRGIGSGLISQVLAIAKIRGFINCRLEVLKENTSALFLYEKLSFKTIEDRGEKLLLGMDIK